MTENIPPSSKPATATTTSDRGIPYYESLRRTLRDTITRKRALDRSLLSLEDQIHRAETVYLEETSLAGNIIKGFDNYIKASAGGAAGTISGAAVGGTRGRKGVVSESDRVFSRSSVGWGERESQSQGGSQAETPVGGSREGSVDEGKGRRKKKKAKDEEDEVRTVKRQKISFTSRRRDDD